MLIRQPIFTLRLLRNEFVGIAGRAIPSLRVLAKKKALGIYPRPVLKLVGGLLAFDDCAPVRDDAQDTLRRVIDVGYFCDSPIRFCGGDAGITGSDQSQNALGAGFAFFCGIRIGRRYVTVFRFIVNQTH